MESMKLMPCALCGCAARHEDGDEMGLFYFHACANLCLGSAVVVHIKGMGYEQVDVALALAWNGLQAKLSRLDLLRAMDPDLDTENKAQRKLVSAYEDLLDIVEKLNMIRVEGMEDSYSVTVGALGWEDFEANESRRETLDDVLIHRLTDARALIVQLKSKGGL